MPSDPNWPRWIFASVSKHFQDRRGTLTFYIEGQERDSPMPTDLLEFRMDGPYETEISKNYWDLYIEVSILIQAMKDDKDYHRIHRYCGLVAQAFTSIPVYKYGDGVDDDQTLLGCLNLVQNVGKHERIQINHFGQIEKDTPLLQSSVEGHYRMDLSTDNQ
jgi:hypothetical protein